MNKSSFLFPFCAIALWAGNVVVSKLSATTIDPSAITFYRLLLAVALMSVFTLRGAWRNRAQLAAHLPKLAVLGFLAMALFQSLSYEAAKTTTATNMAIITALVPLLTMALSSLLLGDPPGVGMVAGGMLSLAGVVYLISGGHPLTIAARGVQPGDLLMLAASGAYALYGVLLKRWHMGALPAWQSTYVQAIVALACMVPMLLRLPAPAVWPTRASVPLILYAGVLASVVLPYLWMQGVKLLGPSRCAMYMNLLPVMTAGIAIVLLGESLKPYHVIGGGVALVGVVIAQRFPVRASAPQGAGR
ncbi:DMT family transporter [Burkholderia pseudomultivorans]|uniref:DMT family transporter n=1 Tax=Burkholderia pseudomultivorans TaxID=1207504 RepID=UPI000759FA49|nr:EamA family transporter [Burkholderia pseudomultivorans]AOI90190.1 multidrug DMT transporter [Burkholderia pseudomultivorans]KVC36638.1 multidrug DMT transporter [Burkholderia pseudomultivorans]MDS0793358.1 DMT family transporter [Burkholderia pseudomultivorans]